MIVLSGFIFLEKKRKLFISDTVEVKPISTRKLRRRPNDPVPIPEKRRKPSPDILYILLCLHFCCYIYQRNYPDKHCSVNSFRHIDFFHY